MTASTPPSAKPSVQKKTCARKPRVGARPLAAGTCRARRPPARSKAVLSRVRAGAPKCAGRVVARLQRHDVVSVAERLATILEGGGDGDGDERG
eukprot:475329-Prymnesium_polylepis.1